jgi:hypothetical protein
VKNLNYEDRQLSQQLHLAPSKQCTILILIFFQEKFRVSFQLQEDQQKKLQDEENSWVVL